MRGRLIVVEGLDGTGKTTLSRALARALGAVWTTTPPPAMRRMRTLFTRLIESRPETSQLFHALGVLLVGLGARALAWAGRDVVVDRYWLTTTVYARARGSGLELSWLGAIVPPADVTLLVRIDETERRRRLVQRGATAQDLETLGSGGTLAARIDEGYRRELATPVAGRGFELDLSGLGPEEALSRASELWSRVEPSLPPAAVRSRSAHPSITQDHGQGYRSGWWPGVETPGSILSPLRGCESSRGAAVALRLGLQTQAIGRTHG